MTTIKINSACVRTTKRGAIIISSGDYWSDKGSSHYRIYPFQDNLRVTLCDRSSSYNPVEVKLPVRFELNPDSWKQVNLHLLHSVPALLKNM